MSAIALISGRLQGEPVTRPTRTGGTLTFITLRVANGSTSEYWSVATFDEAVRAELAGLADGAPLSCSGPFHAEKYEFKGETRVRLKITADVVLVLKPRPRTLKPGRDNPSGGAAPSGRAAAESSWAHPGGGSLDDDLPF
jgi:hypothetical protein